MSSLPKLARVVCLALVAARSADGQAPPVAFPVGEPAFAGRLSGIDREWHLSFETSGKVRVVSAADLAYWGRHRDSETGAQLVLNDGSVIRADLLRLDDQEVVLGDASGLERGLWDESTLPRSALLAVLWHPPADAQARDRLRRRLLEHRGAGDLVLLSGGDEAKGTLISVPPAGRFAPPGGAPGPDLLSLAQARGGGKPLEIPMSKVAAISLGGRQRPLAETARRSAWLGFADGSLLHARAISIKENSASVGLTAGGQLRSTIPAAANAAEFWQAIRYVEPVSPRVQWLADVEPVGYKHIPFLSVNRSYGVNANVLGTRLRSQGAVIPRGIGMPSAARLAYDVAGFRRFEAEIAIDEAAKLAGSVVFKVLLEKSPNEWAAAYESPAVRGDDAPVAISVDLAGAGRMALIVDFAERGDSCDYANWLHARLTK